MVSMIDLESLRGLADPTRRRIVERLSTGGLAVGEIAAGFPMSRPAISKHLRILRELGLVVERREGRRRIYELAAEPFERIVAWLEGLAGGGAMRRDPAASPGSRAPATEPSIAPVKRRPSSRGEGAPPAEEDADGRWRSW